MRDDEISKVLEKYCGKEMVLLRKICDPMIVKFGGITEADYDDFYSIANETVWVAAKQFDDSVHDSFDTFLKGCLMNKFKTVMTRRNRKKRIPANVICSIYSKVSEDSDKTLADVLDSGYRISDEIEELQEGDGFDEFMASLSKKQLQIVEMIIQGYEKDDIKRILNMTDKRYETCIGRLKTFDNRLLLTGKTK